MPRWPTRRQLGVGAAIVVVWLLGLAWFRPWIAHNDFAIFRIALERQLGGDARLVGAHSRLGVFHPGPLREWTFVLPYWLSGRRAAALPATALVVNIGWVIWTLTIARRLRPHLWGAAMATGLVLVVVALGPDIASPWNPHLAILPMYLSVWAAIEAIANGGDGWVAAVVGASFAAQLHASALIVGGVVLLATLVAVIVHRPRRTFVTAVALTAALWAGPIVDLRRGSESNLVRLATVGSDGDAVGVWGAVGHVSRLLWPGTAFARTSVRPSLSELAGLTPLWLLFVAGVVAVVTGWTWGRRHSAGSAADGMTLVAGVVTLGSVLLAVVSGAVFVEPNLGYLYGALQAVAIAALAVAAAVGCARFADTNDRAAWLSWVPVGAAAVSIVVSLVAIDRTDAGTRTRVDLDVEAAVTEALAERPTWRSVTAVPLDLRGAGDLDAEVLDVALRAGVEARSPRPELALPAPDGADGLFAVAMAPTRDCLLDDAGAEEIVSGVGDGGQTFGVFALDVDSDVARRCVG